MKGDPAMGLPSLRLRQGSNLRKNLAWGNMAGTEGLEPSSSNYGTRFRKPDRYVPMKFSQLILDFSEWAAVQEQSHTDKERLLLSWIQY